MNEKFKKFQELHYGSAGSNSGKSSQLSGKQPTPGRAASVESKAKTNKEKFLQLHNGGGYSLTNNKEGNDDFISTFLRDSQNYIRESAETLNRMGWKEAADPGRLSTRAKVSENLRTRSARVRSFLEENRGNIAPERYDMLRSYLDDFDADAASISRSFDEGKAYYGQWDTEDDYNAYQNARKEYERKVNLDIGSADQEIRDLEKLHEEMSNFIKNDLQGMTFNPDAYDPEEVAAAKERYGQFSEQYGDLSKLEKLINEKKRYRNQAEYIQKGVALAGAAQNEDFKNYSGYISTESDGWLDRLTSKYGLGYQDLTYEYINNQNGIRDEIESKWAAYNTDSVSMGNQSEYAAKGYDLLTKDEVAIYNYYYAKEGRDKAQEYLDSIQETLNQRKASSIYAGMEGKTGLELIYGAEAGLDQFKTGMQNLFNGKDTYIAPSSAQMASAMVREDLADNGPKLPEWMGGASLGQAGYDAITTTANMAPSMLASVAANMIVPGSGAVVGTGLIGASAAGNAYQEALNEGYDKKSARAYSTLVGASEAGLQYLLGGISKLGGKVTGKALSKMLDGIDNAFARVALELGGNMISEGAEEGLQEILTPLFKSWTLKTDEDVNWSEVAYSTLLGALTAGVTEGPGTVSNGIKIREQTRGLKLGEAFEDLQDDTTTGNQTDAVADDVTDPGGLSLPSVENDARAPGFVTQNAQNGTQTQVNDTALPAGVPLSIADQLRQEQAQNGGTQYERTYERAAGPATSQPAGELYIPGGAGISDGSAERNAGAGTAEQTGILASSPEQRRSAYADRSRATVARQNYARSLRLEKVSSLDLGLQNGTEARNIQVMPQESWDAEMSQLADRIYNETGKGVTYVMGRIQIRGTGGTVGYARGVITGDRIIVQADHLRIPMEQIADHEAYHAKVDFTDGRLNDEIRRHIVETFSEEQFRQVLDKYIVGLRGVIDVNEARTGEEFEAAVRQIEEEIFADAYAGINAFSAGADQFTDAVNEKMDQLYMGKIRNQDNGTEAPTGPPSDRYSYAGENANNADLDALARAKEMRSAGVADETIRQQTGWHTGMDGKWRWEIDDSGMEYSGRGDMNFRQRNKNYDRYRQLTEKQERHMLELSDEQLTEAETKELQRLRETYASTFRRPGRVSEDALPMELLSDYIKHDALFEAYPQLRKTRLRFADLPEGTRGQYDPEQDIITLSNKLRGKPQDTLIHEIQHVIQKAEGFAQGSSPEFWEQVQKGEQPVRANDRRVAEAERKIQEIMDSLPPFVAGQFELHRHLEKSDPDKAMELADALSEGPYGDEFSDFFLLTWNLDMAAGEDNYIRGAGDLYRNTAGEIEARNAASRRQLTAEQRRSEEPARADDQTVFVEDVDDLSLQLGDRFSAEDDAYMEAVNNGDMKAAQRMVDAAAERWGAYLNNDEANEVFRQDGRVRTFYHGTNTGDFTKFDSRLLGSSSGDLGWFGKGFYFAFSHDEAATYGGRVIPAYLRMRNPYDYSRLYQFKGSDKGAAKYARFAWVYNITKQFPDIAEGQHVWAYPNDAEEGSAVSWKQLTTWMDQIQNKKQFSVEEVELNDGTTAWELRADPKKESFTTASGETFEWTEYGMTQIFATEQDAKEPINQIGAYLKNVMGVDSVPRRTIEKIDFSGALQRAGYDGILQSMSGDEAVVFSPEQIKTSEPVTYDDEGKVIPLSKRFSSRNSDIRYSVDDEGSQQTQEQKPAAPKKKIRPVAESRPLIAKKDLRSTVLNLFSIPNGQRAEVGAMIDSYADRLIKNGSLTEDDRKAFFDRMYDAGVMVMPAEEYSAFARSHIVDGRIYVSDSVKADFGDDWADIRRRAFAAGVYLVNDRSASGIDQWNATLSAEDMLPGLFDSEETDERTILERILQVAEEGKDEHLSLAEYTRRLSQQEGISEDEFLDNMERQLDWALRTFAEKARLDVHLRDRTGRKIAQEREKGAERMTRQQAKEAQRRADERQARKDSARRAKERRELRELQQRTLKQLQWLSKNRFRAPEELQATWDEVLSDIDIYAISAADEMRWSDKHNATWKDLVEMYDKAKAEDPNFFESKELERFVARLRYKKLEDLDIDALNALYKLATGLRTKFYNQKNVINDEMQRLFAEVYTDSKREIESAPGENSAKKGKVSGWADKFLNMDQLTPMNVLQRMAGWDPNGAFYSMAKQLERGERDMRAYSVKAQKMLQDFLTEHEDWVKKADGQGKDGLWYKIEIPELVALELGKTPQFGGTIEVWMTPMQKIHMYLESKNQDNLRHMTGGRTFADKQIYSEGKRQEAFAQGKTVRMAPETVKAIVKDLTAEEMELAQILDRYYNTFATQEINKVSNILYGYDKAMGKNYAPIYTNQNYTKTEFGVFDTTAEGVGNLKGRQYAVNPSYNISAFDAFERHVDQTARFCGMAIPARNWTNLMNWREKNNSTGDVITHKWGEEGKRYITDLITTLQAGDDAKSDTISSGLSKLQSNYITAIFGANPSIVLKQLGSIPLAGAYLDARNMPTPAQISKIDRSLISKYTQELEWRTMGYATPETKQLKDNPNWTQTNKAFKFVFGGGAITAMDGWAASTLWPWAENKVRREHPELAVGTKAQIDAGESAFYKKVAEEFEIAVSRSQSVSDEIHQGTLRKSKNPITKAFTMFRSDSAQTYNALRQKIGEARYYMRTGAKEKVVQTAKKAAGAAFVAMLLNAAWSEAISFLMALWKNKGKYYRDDEDELTLQSVVGEMVSNMLGSYAGVVTGGEELFELIGNIITGDTWYGIETPGMEQLNDLLDTLIESGSGMRDLVAGGWDVLKNGGNLGDYFSKHSGEMLGGIKDLAKAAAMYLSGMPASNLEAYLTGAMKWISPELGAAYDDLFAETGKSDLAGMEGDALEGRVGRILSDRNVSESDDTAAALAALYEAGYKTAIPSDTPTSVSIDGEKHSLGEYQQQAYDTIWGGIVADALDDMVASDSFKEADPKTQAKMLSNLYTYAAEQAKAELFDEYELDSGATKNAAIVAAGATVAECITWNTITSEMKSGEKSAELVSWDIPEEAKREIFRSKISDSREDSIAAFDEAGLSFDQFLRAYSMYGQINNEDLKAGMKAVEFSHWVNAQGYTAEQAAVIKDELTYFNMTPASSSRYDELVESGMDPDDAYDLTEVLNELQPEDGEDKVSDLKKWRASVDFSDNVDDQLAALSAVMTDAQFQKVEIANNFGVSPDAYVTLQEIKPQYDADGNGSYKQKEIQAAVDGLPGYYTTEQKAVLWQLATGSTSSRNNPYSRQVGQQVLDARAAAKEAAAQEQTEAPTDSTDDDSFSQVLLDQLLGRG